jgi:RNA polymerase sigma-70 factor (ECF subfamily)
MMRRDPLSHPAPLIRRVYSFVAYRIGEGPEAEDVTSEVFERALRYRDSYDASKGEPVAWLLGIARRCIEGPDMTTVSSADAGSQVAAPGDLEDDATRRLAVRAAVARLDPRDRELIALRYGADLSARQIGEILEARTNTIEVALHRALARLRELLTDESPTVGKESDATAVLGVERPSQSGEG